MSHSKEAEETLLPTFTNGLSRHDQDGVLTSSTHSTVTSPKPSGDNFRPYSNTRKQKSTPYEEIASHSKSKNLPAHDRPRFALLVLLYFLQGIPVGLAFGSIPFILKSGDLSYSQIGIFSLASYPYAMKLLWSPIVDSIYWPKVGRRRSWIIPVQTVSGFTLIFLGAVIDKLMLPETLGANLYTITYVFFLLVLFCATQDIAVDGWALTIISKQALSYASTAQTIGLNTGYFLSFTVFLAFNSPDFANKRSTIP
ncbi:unnamed protein product [Ambrosiozyma monospora]|uniref:Unnamed protein product n=1 Tax=Ambrosiozyma monospora TaxID=43982 RepID=A0ACB5SXM1_AMBMO|nr:unnamed protein product [Ambrosiozyma monospora]